MNQALYLKYRPEKFADVLGQDHVIAVLEGSIKKEDIAHAYLFSGTRGTGKTSVARIFAREVGTDDVDIYEIDAASNRGIDEIRELREAVHTLPYKSQYKVYIVDEVHMLTTPAFNALLKTLEEPPEHVIFILATTEFDKLPETVVSRCQVHEFRKPSAQSIKVLLKKIAKKEDLDMDEASDDLIAMIAEGSYRDAIGVLQKVVSAVGGKKIIREKVEEITGAPKVERVNTYIEALLSGDSKKGIEALRQAVKVNADINLFAKIVMQKVRGALLYKIQGGHSKEMEKDLIKEDLDFIKAISEKKNLNAKLLKDLIDAYSQIGYSYIKHLPLELLLIDKNEESEASIDKSREE